LQLQQSSVEHKATSTASKYAKVSICYRTNIVLHYVSQN